uniref:Uncharacterized protein n=1 Tax=Arundo donax TaxID=35708 RepID=A0A0A9G9D7_ARUDO
MGKSSALFFFLVILFSLRIFISLVFFGTIAWSYLQNF